MNSKVLKLLNFFLPNNLLVSRFIEALEFGVKVICGRIAWINIFLCTNDLSVPGFHGLCPATTGRRLALQMSWVWAHSPVEIDPFEITKILITIYLVLNCDSTEATTGGLRPATLLTKRLWHLCFLWILQNF